MKNHLQFVITLFFCLHFYFTHAQELNTKMWQPDGPVRAIVQKDSTIYLAGDFTYVGPLNCQNGAIIDQPEGKPSKHSTLRINNIVLSSISDGKGGWYIGGLFTSVQGVSRKYVAHILANGQLDLTWNPNSNGRVDAIFVFNNIVYIGGIFTSVGGKVRSGLAALDATTA
ncbi:MAG: delta-60 repeat domain-containing protein, partial [Saprospiraceae bacterium]|nr:delta-60 repeat domain-containing protein [Saprospiraceae bacterium]